MCSQRLFNGCLPVLAFGVLWSWSAPLAVAQGQASQRPPNIIFFLADDMRFDAMGCAGHPIIKTPTMDKLARTGVYFRNAFVTTSICAASRASILTALHERTHRYTFGEPPLRPEHVSATYPLLLRRAGYRTGFIGKFGVGVPKGTPRQLFDVFADLSRSPYFKKQADGSVRHIDDIAGDQAIAFLRDCPREHPFCLSVSFNSPHAEDSDKENHHPWAEGGNGLYEKGQVFGPRLFQPEIFQSQPEFLQKSMNRIRYFWAWDTPAKYQKNIRAYYRMVSGIDHVMGRVLAELQRLGLDDNTIIIFAGDNGYLLADRGLSGKWIHYEESLRVPLIICDPRQPQSQRGRTVEAMALNIDIPATILDLAGVAAPKLYQGRSLTPLLRGQTPDDWRSDFFCEHLMRHKDLPRWEGVRDRRWVYARYFEQQPPFEFLHDLQSDPDELQNLAKHADHAEQLGVMRKRCDELRDSYGGPYKPQPLPQKKPKKQSDSVQKPLTPNPSPRSTGERGVVWLPSPPSKNSLEYRGEGLFFLPRPGTPGRGVGGEGEYFSNALPPPQPAPAVGQNIRAVTEERPQHFATLSRE